MASVFEQIAKNKIVQGLSSLKISVIGLLLLFILTFWGTVAQVSNGLYASQGRYFSSFYFLAGGFLPFPGAQLVLWVLFLNLVCALFTTMRYTWSQVGLLIVHYGLILFLVAAFVTFHEARESHLTLREGQAANVSEAYSDWEIAFWPDPSQGTQKDGAAKTVTAADANSLIEGNDLSFTPPGVTFNVKTYYKNCEAFSAPFAGIKEKYFNASNINVLKASPVDKEPEKNLPAVILQLNGSKDNAAVLLYGGDPNPTQVPVNGKAYFMSLRHKHYPLPVTIKLITFMMEKHPGTDVARTYKSKVEVQSNGGAREVVISMNEPLRYKDFTFYQASYSTDPMGRQSSTFATVKNSGRLLPYIATFVTFFGLALHFLMAAFGALNTRRI